MYIQKEEQEENQFLTYQDLTFTLRILAQWEEYHSVELVVAALGEVGVEEAAIPSASGEEEVRGEILPQDAREAKRVGKV